jgi:hypothetical protein
MYSLIPKSLKIFKMKYLILFFLLCRKNKATRVKFAFMNRNKTKKKISKLNLFEFFYLCYNYKINKFFIFKNFIFFYFLSLKNLNLVLFKFKKFSIKPRFRSEKPKKFMKFSDFLKKFNFNTK